MNEKEDRQGESYIFRTDIANFQQGRSLVLKILTVLLSFLTLQVNILLHYECSLLKYETT